MTTEELNALIAQAEGGDVSAMNQLTHIYAKRGENTAALKWFRILLREENDPKSKFYHNTKYYKALCEKIVGTIENAISDIKMDNIRTESASGMSLFSNAVVFASKQAQSDIRIIRKIWDDAEKEERKEQKQVNKLEAEIKRIEKGFSHDDARKFFMRTSNPCNPLYPKNPNNKRMFVIPNGVKRIGNYFFYQCECLSSVTIPASVNSIGTECFEGCCRLKTIIVPRGTKEKFMNMRGMKKYASIIVEE